MGTIEKLFYRRVTFVFMLSWLVDCGGSLRVTPRRSRCVGSSFLISSSPSVFSVVYLNRMDRDFAIFRRFGLSEFQAEFHAGLVELTVQITHQRIDQSVARALSHILPTPIDAAHGVRSFVCSVDNMRAIRIHHESCFLRARRAFNR